MSKRPRGKTLHDVAEYSGVSYQTVSRVVNHHPNVSPDTRERVQSAIDTLGYKPNKVAKSLAAKQSNTLALITFGMDYYGPTQMILNIERISKELNYDLIFSNVHESSGEQIGKVLESLSGRQVDGIVAILPVEGATYEELASLCPDIPIVQIDPKIDPTLPSVVVEQYYGSQMITEYLIQLGHRRIAEISGPLNWFGAQARHQQWQETMRHAGLLTDLSVEGEWTPHSGYGAVQHLLTQSSDFTAIVAGNDQMALGAIHALREHDLRVPEDVSVVGFDDMPEAAYFQPPLTTIRQDFSQLGVIAVEYLLERIANPLTPLKQHVIYPQLIIRESATSPKK
jgi:DNA-binding LacI/PurR family transcriptional regulator